MLRLRGRSPLRAHLQLGYALEQVDHDGEFHAAFAAVTDLARRSGLCTGEGLPFVHDVHHHRCNPDGLSIEEAHHRSQETPAMVAGLT